MLICRLNRLGPASSDLGLAVLARFRPGLGQAEAGPDLTNCLFYVSNASLYFWFPGRFWPGLGRSRALVWLKRLGQNRPGLVAPAGLLTSLIYIIIKSQITVFLQIYD